VKKSTLFLLPFLYIVLNTPNCHSCTGITLKSEDGSFIFGRTLELAQDLNSDLIIVPRGYKYIGSTPEGKNGMQWSVKYGFVAMNASVEPTLAADGLNEKGLAVGIFYLPGYTKYETYNKDLESKTLAPIEFATWLLSNFAKVKDVKNGLGLSRVVNVAIKSWYFVPPLHFMVTDQTGASIVIEYIDGMIKVHNNPIGVITNAPSFDWHITNLSNYVNLSPLNKTSIKLGTLKIKPFGEGSGMLGLPGDFTPPSRFIRATIFSKNVLPGKNATETVRQTFHVLNQFDIPKGIICSKNRKKTYDKTQWTSASDTNNKQYYIHTINNRTIRKVDLKKADLNAKNIVTIPVNLVDEKIEDLTPIVKKINTPSDS